MTEVAVNPQLEEFKTQGNKAFADKHFAEAVAAYSKAIEIKADWEVLWNNRAFAQFKQENYGAAIADASKAIEIKPDFVKAFYRRGSANVALGKFKAALEDFRQATKLAPKDPDAVKKYKECEKQVRKEAFEAAIACDDKKSVFETLKPDEIFVDKEYNGPALENGEVTFEFIMAMIQWFKDGKNIHKKHMYQILFKAQTIFKALPNVLKLSIPVDHPITVCGDTHGQFYDLLNLFKLSGWPSPTNPMVFNGDFVDRGSWSCENILTFLCFKILYPEHFHLLRGNHETKNMNKIYGFDGEVKAKYGETAVDIFEELFCSLPLCAVLGGKVFVVHGGLFAKDGVTIEDIDKVNRFRQPPDEGIMCDMLWSDPSTNPGRTPSLRGVGVAFGPDVTEKFLETNKLDLVVRSHEVKPEGYHMEPNGKLVTVFSAPNYCDQMGNKAAFVRFTNGSSKPNFTTFAAVEHPAVKPLAYASNFSHLMGQ